MSKLSKTIKQIVKSANEIGELDMDAETQEAVMLPLLSAAQITLAAILSMGTSLTNMGDDSDEDGDEDDTDEDDDDSDDDSDEDGDEDDTDEDDTDEDDDDFADDDDDDTDEDDDDADDSDEDEDEDEDEEPAPKKTTKKPAAKVTKPAAKAPPAKKSKKVDYSAMPFKELKELLLADDKKRAKAIATATDDVGPRGKTKALVTFATKKGWIS